MEKDIAAKEAVLSAKRGNFRRALALFEEGDCYKVNPLSTSYYALALATVRKEYDGALLLSIEAAKKEFFNPDIYLNIGRICLLTGRKDLAFKAFRKGLQLDRTHRGIIKEAKRLGIRRAPPIPALPRGHILNKLLGKLAYELKKIRKREKTP